MGIQVLAASLVMSAKNNDQEVCIQFKRDGTDGINGRCRVNYIMYK